MIAPDDAYTNTLNRPDYSIDGYERDLDPPRGERVRILAEDHRGEYAIPFDCMFTSDAVVNADLQTPIAAELRIVGWRLP